MWQKHRHELQILQNEVLNTIRILFLTGHYHCLAVQSNKQQTPWPLVRKRTIPTEQPPLVDEI
jgi:hypothetical protein